MGRLFGLANILCARGITLTPEEADEGRWRKDLFDKLDPLGREVDLNRRQPGEISAGLCETSGQSSYDRINPGHENDRASIRSVSGREDCRCSRGNDQVNVLLEQCPSNFWKLLRAGRQPKVNDQVLALDIAKVPQPLPERLDEARWRLTEPQEADTVYASSLLSMG
jgi:hypothetical protein